MRFCLIVLSASLVLTSNMLVAEEKIRTHGGVIGDPTFLEAGQWWNLFCSEGNDPLKRSIRAVKILHVSKQHPGWVQIAYPKSRDEHFSMFGPAAKAHDDDSVSKSEALAKWEKSVSEWMSIWVNLDHVVNASRVAKNPSTEEKVYKVKESSPTASQDEDDRNLNDVILQINEKLLDKYGLLGPEPLTVGRFRDAVNAAIERHAKSEEDDRTEFVRVLQRVLAEERLPDGYLLYFSAGSADYKEESLEKDVLGKKVVNLRYILSVPVAAGREKTQPVRLRSLAEQFFILKKKIEWTDNDT